jgi:hypothetical protein
MVQTGSATVDPDPNGTIEALSGSQRKGSQQSVVSIDLDELSPDNCTKTHLAI